LKLEIFFCQLTVIILQSQALAWEGMTTLLSSSSSYNWQTCRSSNATCRIPPGSMDRGE